LLKRAVDNLGSDIEIEVEAAPELILGALEAVDERALDDELVVLHLLDGDTMHLDPALDDFNEAKVVDVVLHLRGEMDQHSKSNIKIVTHLN
jgi:hypothetical protein